MNKRISALDNLGATPAVGDILPITDIDDPTGSPQGTTKGVTFSDLTNHLATAVSLGNHASLTSAVHGISAFGATLVDDADAATARTTLGVDAAGTDNSTDVTLSGTPDYITIVGQTITRNQIDLATDVTGLLPNASVDGLGTAATTASTDYATAAQGATADSATQPGDNISTLTNDSGFIDSSGAPVQSVAGKTGVVTLSNTDVSGLGTASTQDVGTANGNVVQLDVTGLPAVDGSQLTNVSGTDSTKLAIASNLSDLANAATARTNLGLGTAATTASTDYATAAQGATADTATQPGDNISTLINDSGFITGLTAGALSDFDFDDNAIFGFKASLPTEITTATYSVADADNGKVIRVNHASGCTVTIPSGLLTTDSSGFNCSFVQVGAGAITFANDGTSAINNRQSHTKTNGQWAVASVVSTSNNVFVLAGDTTA